MQLSTSAVISLLWMVLVVMPLRLVRGLVGLLVKAIGARHGQS